MPTAEPLVRPPLPCPSSRWWRDRRGWPLALVGVVLVASGLVHLGVWAARGGGWEGSVTWRKPILFGVSGGLTSLSLGWVWTKVAWRRGDRLLAHAAAWALLIEVMLIDVQRWRGVASHFNRATPLDSFLYDAMGVLILFVTLVVADLTLRIVTGPTVLDPDMHLAAAAGLALLLVSCGLGIWASIHGDLQAVQGLAPELYGRAGVTKFPHGIAIHAIQWLPLVAWAARKAGLPAARRRRLVMQAILGSGLVLAYSLLQTLSGRGRFDAPPIHAAVLAIGTALLVGPGVEILAAWAAGRGAR